MNLAIAIFALIGMYVCVLASLLLLWTLAAWVYYRVREHQIRRAVRGWGRAEARRRTRQDRAVVEKLIREVSAPAHRIRGEP